jgi:hypothetical protein
MVWYSIKTGKVRCFKCFDAEREEIKKQDAAYHANMDTHNAAIRARNKCFNKPALGPVGDSLDDLRAAERLGWGTIPVTVVDLDEIARGEFAENAVRKDFTLSEAVAIKRALEPIERAKAKERMLAGKPSEKFRGGQGQCARQDRQGDRCASDHTRQGGGRGRCRRGRAREVRQAARGHGPHRTRERHGDEIARGSGVMTRAPTAAGQSQERRRWPSI